mgnify:CR=1 FL=1|tara:strand:+ start:340 stop:684 length:345 start_codon:yes stop_codon:yes gene_type:complete
MKNIKLLEAKRYISKLIREKEEIETMDTKTVSGLADYFLTVSKALRKGEYKGLQAAEIDEIDDLVKLVLQGAMDGNITAVLKRVEAMVGKTVKTPMSPDELSQDNPKDFEEEEV